MIDQFLRKSSLLVFILLLKLATGSVWAQTGRPMPGAPAGATPVGGGDKVELIHADSLNVLNQPGAVVYRVIRNVKLQQKGVVLYCDLAIQNKTTNVIEAYGNVRMVQGDTINVRGDTLYYYGNTRQANVLGNVVLKDRKMTLSTARLDYDMLSGVAHYPVKGRIVDRENILTSDEGYYNTGTKQFIFQHNVRLLNQPVGKEKTTILADSLLYNSLTKIADFQGPTRIISKDGVLVAKNGQYNTTTRVSNFRQRATAETEKYTLTGDTLNFDNVNELGVAHGNVVIVNKADKTTLTGDHGRYNGKAGVSRMIGHAVVRSPISQGADLDTLFMRADTLFSFDNKLTKRKKLVGQRNVLVYKSDLQSKCDSLVYDVNDSLLYFYKKPIVWSQNYQMEADSMTAKLKSNRINVMFLKSRAFVISQDTLLNFNQVKGRSITAYFRTILAPAPKTTRPSGPMTASSANRPALSPVVTTTATAEKTTLDRVLVEGNGQTIYFAVDEKNKLVGMNRTECSKMNIEFTNSRVTRIRNYGRPDMFLTPPKELTDEKKQLDGFRWREKEKPTKAQTLGLTPLNEPKPTAPTNAVATLRDKFSEPDIAGAKTIVGQLANKNMPAKTAKAIVDKALAVNPAELAASAKKLEPIASKLAPAAAALINQPTRKPLLDRPVAPLLAKPFKPLTVTNPVLDVKPVSAKPVTGTTPVREKPVEPIADEPGDAKPAMPAVAAPVAQPILEKVTEPAVAEPATTLAPDQPSAPAVAEPVSKPVVDKAAEPINPVSSGTSSNTLPTRRADKQQKTDTTVTPKVKTAVPDESDLEQELNRKPKKRQ